MMVSLSLIQAFITLLLLALVTAWLFIEWAYHRQLSLARKLPTAIPAYPLIGHLNHLKTTLKVGCQTWKLYLGHRSGLSVVWLGPVPWIFINKAEYVKVILNNSNLQEKAELYNTMHYVLGNGLLTAPVNLWKISRKHINPMFHSESLQLYIPLINETACQLVEDLSEHVDKEVFDCEDYSTRFSILNMIKLLFGADVETYFGSEELKDMFKQIKLLATLLGERAYNPFLKSDTVFKLLRKQAVNNLEALRKHLKVLTENSQEQIAAVESNGQINTVKTFQDIFTVLKGKYPIFNEDYMLNELLTLVSAGTATNAVAISSCLAALGSHPEIQKHLYDEIISVVGDSSEVCPEDINRMTYLDQVLKETLRCFTVAPLVARRCDRDIQLGGYSIPEGTTVAISFFGLHNDEEVFPDPLSFDPDRFSPDNIAKRHSYSFLPFSGGPRNCIGKNYAMMSMKIILVHLLKNYEIKSNVEIKNIIYSFSISMVNVDGYKISIKRRT